MTILELGTNGGSDLAVLKGTNDAETGRADALTPFLDPEQPANTITATRFTVNGGSTSNTVDISSRIENAGLYLRGGNDRFAVRTINVAATIDPGTDDDVILLGSLANETTGMNSGGTLDGIDVALSLSGGAGNDVVRFDDTGDISANSGVLTQNLLTGLGLATGGVGYLNFETVELSLGSGGDSLAIQGTALGATTTVNMGAGSDTVDISTDAPTNAGHLNELRGALTVDAGTGATEIIRVSDAGDGTPNTGTLTPTTITGLGTAGITYLGFTQLILTLGSGSDTLDVQGTIPGSTTINGGNGNDRLTLATLTGVVLVNAGGGDDHATIRSTVAGSAVTFNGDAGADWLDIVAMLGTVTVAGGSDNDTIEVGSNSETTLRAVDLGGNVNAIAGILVVNGNGGSDALYLDETGDASSAAVNDGILTSTTVTGLGLGNPLTYGTLELLTIRLGAGDTQFDVLSTANASVLELGDGSDVVNVSSDAPSNLGTLDLLAGHLTIDGQAGVDTVNLSDVGDTDDNTGTLTSTDLTGLDTAGVTYAALEFLNIGLGSGNDTFNVQSTLLGALTTVDAGPGTDRINVSSDAPANLGTVDLLAGHLVLRGGTGADVLVVSDVSDTTDDTGRLTDTTITGLDTAGIEYFSFVSLTITLGSGADTFFVDSTHAGETTLNTGPGTDLVYIETIAGRTWVNGNAGNDTIRVNHLLDQPSTANGIGALLTLDGGAGDDLYVINEFGNGNSTIEVYDSGAALERNELIVNGTPNADLFLLRARLVALLNSPTEVERIRYTGSFEPGDVGGVWRYGLLINALGGDDHFALDDNTRADDDQRRRGQRPLPGRPALGRLHACRPDRGARRPPDDARRAHERRQLRDDDQRRERQRLVLDLQQHRRR